MRILEGTKVKAHLEAEWAKVQTQLEAEGEVTRIVEEERAEEVRLFLFLLDGGVVYIVDAEY